MKVLVQEYDEASYSDYQGRLYSSAGLGRNIAGEVRPPAALASWEIGTFSTEDAPRIIRELQQNYTMPTKQLTAKDVEGIKQYVLRLPSP